MITQTDTADALGTTVRGVADAASTLYTTSGEVVRLGPELGRGGEGAVYEVNGRSDLVAKVYHEAASPAKAEKLERMAAARTVALSSVAAWPMAALTRRRGGGVHGLLMPRIVDHEEAHLLYGPKSRQAEFPRADYRFLVHAAANVARAFGVIHGHGHAVGDVNHSGVLVSERATVTLIDCDSFQVRVGGEVYRCEVGVPEYTPPELQGHRLDRVVRTPEHDAFGLAVMVFHLLFMGRHPYVGRPTDADHVPLARAITEHRFAYGPGARGRKMEAPPHTLPLESASPSVAALFERAFAPPAARRPRPTPAEWVGALGELGEELQGCREAPSHTYWKGLSDCPWCTFEKTVGFDYFPPAGASGGQGRPFDLAAVWAAIERVSRPPSVAPVRAFSGVPQVPPSDRAQRLNQQLQEANGWGGLGMRVGVDTIRVAALISLFGAGYFLWQSLYTAMEEYVAPEAVLLLYDEAILLVCLAWALNLIAGYVPKKRRWKMLQRVKPELDEVAEGGAVGRREIEAATADLDAARQEYGTARDLYERAAYGSLFDAKKRELMRARSELEALPGERQDALRKLSSKARELLLDRYLSQFRIARCSIPGIGEGRKETLISYGIEDAADVTRYAVKRVPGFGPKLARRLSAWRRSIEDQFRFDPKAALSPADVARVNGALDQKERQLQQSLLGGAAKLERICRTAEVALSRCDAARQRYEGARTRAEFLARRHAQAIADADLLAKAS